MEQARAWFDQAMGGWHQGKLFIEHGLAVDHDALHVIAGVIVWLIFALVLRQRLSQLAPFVWTTAVALWNEVVDFWVEIWPDPGQQFGESFKDLVLTILVPLMLMIVIRVRPQLFAKPSGTRRRR